MPRLVLSKEFFSQLPDLPKNVQKRIGDTLEKFTVDTKAGLHLEKPKRIADSRTRTVRIDQFWRGVVVAPEEGDTFVLVAVLPHDKAYDWCERNVFSVNSATGAFEVQDLHAVERVAEHVAAAPPTKGLFDGFNDKDLANVGVPATILPVVRNLETEDQLEALTSVLPPLQGEALRMLAAGYSIEEAYAELVAEEKPKAVDPEDIAAAVERPASKAMFYVVQDAADLIDVLNRPLDTWRIFLHPSQRRIAYRKRFSGPVRVTGGAGTGKTVVAIHRAKHLADQLPAGVGRRVLLTTFTTTLAENLRGGLVALGGEKVLQRVDVITVDALAHRVVRERDRAVKAIGGEREAEIWQTLATELPSPLGPYLVQQEWQQVILAQGIRSKDEYFSAARPGRGVRLNRSQRAAIWAVVELFCKRLSERNERTFLQLADESATLLAARAVRPYVHVVIDEAQDLHPAQWRLLRSAAVEGPNDMFICADAHQRIYDHRVSLSSLGVNIRGRSFRLRLNYRTTHEILIWTLGILTGERFDDLDAGTETLAGYRSELHGPPPTVEGFGTRAQELEALVGAVRAWLDSGIQADDIAVGARTRWALNKARQALETASIPASFAEQSRDVTGAVVLGTMHRLKGLEFRCVAVTDTGAGSVPLPQAVRAAADDTLGHQQDLQRERCLLYVACTRARDMLRVSWTNDPSPFLAPILPQR